jgi:DNA polymerase (family 10)
MSEQNEQVAGLLDRISELLSLTGGSPYRARAYADAARSVRGLNEDIDGIYRAGNLDEIRGVGESIATKIAEYLETGRSSYYEELKQEVPSGETGLLEVPGVGPARARDIYAHLGISDAAGLAQAAREHRLSDIPGIGPAMEERIGREAERAAQRSRRMLLDVALTAAEAIVNELRLSPAVLRIDPAGSLRRMQETIGDIDILASTDRPAEVQRAFTQLSNVAEVLWEGEARTSILTKGGLQVDLRIIAPAQYGSGLLYFTGSKQHNIALRLLAIRRGWKLSEYGLFDRNGERLAGSTEEEIYQALDMDWIPPELRTDRGEIQAAQRHQLPKLVSLTDIKGDLHTHTDWSDGSDSAEKIVEAAIAKGYEYVALTDHSASLKIAHGLSVERVREQRRLIDGLNERYTPFRILHGAEVDILPDGRLDYPDEVLAEFDVVMASVHRAFRLPKERQTKRILAAIANPHLDILSHPTGRLLQRREPYDVDLDAILAAAVKHDVALEIDGQPARMDLDHVWSRRAREAGVMLACNSDAHSARQLDFMRYAIAIGRRGWLEAPAVINTLPLAGLLNRLRRS